MNPSESTTPSVYQKLPGGGSSALQHVRLYLGPDHLLQVTSNGFTESYQRFFFSDIQAITYHHTITGRILNGALIALSAFFLLIGLAAGDNVLWLLSAVAFIWILMLALNLAAGPTCACYLKTAVQTRRLPTLGRVRRARKIIDRLRPALALAQGAYSTEELTRHLNPEIPAAPVTTAPVPPAPSIRADAGSDPQEAPPVVDRPA